MCIRDRIDNGVQPQLAHQVVRELSKVFNPRNSRVGDYYEVVASTDGIPLEFSYYGIGKVYYEVAMELKESKERVRKDTRINDYRTTGTAVYAAAARELPVRQIRRQAKGKIETSLWAAMSEEGIQGELIIRFAEVFESQIDFLTEPRRGDEYRVIWEEKEIDTKPAKKVITGTILGAQYIGTSGRSPTAYTAIGYGNEGLEFEHYSPDGQSLRLAFLKAPLSYRRISSFFSKRRKHPILKIYRPHHGIDYAAPTGTPVSAIGSGVVSFRGWSGGYGNVVRIRHPNGYESVYGHLSKFGKINKGTKVNKGQVIGYVGTTGVSTGPHLHFEMRLRGKPLNFLRLKLPSTKKIPSKFMEDFQEHSAEVIEELEKM